MSGSGAPPSAPSTAPASNRLAPRGGGGGGSGHTPLSAAGRRQLVLDKLRHKSSDLNSLFHLAKLVRGTLLDRRFVLDSVEKDILQKALEHMHQKIPIRLAINKGSSFQIKPFQ